LAGGYCPYQVVDNLKTYLEADPSLIEAGMSPTSKSVVPNPMNTYLGFTGSAFKLA
jgi:hypothetical protein